MRKTEQNVWSNVLKILDTKNTVIPEEKETNAMSLTITVAFFLEVRSEDLKENTVSL